MTELLNKAGMTITSREIAELTGKRHDNVIRDCDKLNTHYEHMGLLKLEEGYYTTSQTGSQQHREYLLTKIQTFDLMTGYDTGLRIKVNRRWEELEANVNTPIELTRMQILEMAVESEQRAIDAEDKANVLEAKNAHQESFIRAIAPKAELADKLLNAEELLTMSQAAKVMNLPYGRNTLFRNLRAMGILFKSSNEPKQVYVEAEYFALKEIYIEAANKMMTQTYVTQKGLQWLIKKLNAEYR